MNGKAVMKAEDTVNGILANCMVMWGGTQHDFIQAVRLKARFEKIKGEDGRIIGWKGTGKMEFYYNDSVFRRMVLYSKETGEDIHFEMQVTNYDPASRMGCQTILLKDCCIERGILTEFDAESDYLMDEMEFTFGDFEVIEKFQCQRSEGE